MSKTVDSEFIKYTAKDYDMTPDEVLSFWRQSKGDAGKFYELLEEELVFRSQLGNPRDLR